MVNQELFVVCLCSAVITQGHIKEKIGKSVKIVTEKLKQYNVCKGGYNNVEDIMRILYAFGILVLTVFQSFSDGVAGLFLLVFIYLMMVIFKEIL